MSVIMTLTRRELASHFLSLRGYVIMAGVQLLLGASLLTIVYLLNGRAYDLPFTEKFPQTETDPINELIIFHNPSFPSQLSQILSKISNDIDNPARQIMIEAMILEVSETALDELGVKWTKAEGANNSLGNNLSTLSIGSLQHPSSGAALELLTKGGGNGLIEGLEANVQPLKINTLSLFVLFVSLTCI